MCWVFLLWILDVKFLSLVMTTWDLVNNIKMGMKKQTRENWALKKGWIKHDFKDNLIITFNIMFCTDVQWNSQDIFQLCLNLWTWIPHWNWISFGFYFGKIGNCKFKDKWVSRFWTWQHVPSNYKNLPTNKTRGWINFSF